MPQSQFSLSWEEHKKNICSGLSSLQQNGEFVDMTLAADGHLVKVHQVIMALASPYIKELISTAQCPHPVIFLNKISYTTLSAILEYIYTGEVLVSLDNLYDLVEAGKELCIKGLEDVKVNHSFASKEKLPQKETKMGDETLDDKYHYFISNSNDDMDLYSMQKSHQKDQDESQFDTEMQEEERLSHEEDDIMPSKTVTLKTENVSNSADTSLGVMQYTVSNRGSLQMILNRFVYYLKHTNRDRSRQWRCVDYLTAARCPALVFTNDEVVLQRVSSHVHPFHDQKILKKVRAGSVFTAITEAVLEGQAKKNQKPPEKMENESNTID